MHEFLQDLKFGWRTLAKSPGFTSVALGTLAIGIGANTAIFSFVNAVLLQPLPYDEPDRIVRVLEKPPGDGRNGISTLNYLDWEKENTVFEFMSAQTGGSVTLTGVAEPVRLRGMRVSAHYFEIFAVKAALGRTFADEEDDFGKDQVVVISHAFWQSQFGGDPGVLGQVLQLDGRPHTVIGILPEGSAFDRAWPQVWRPLAFAPENMTRDFHWFWALARLKPGVTLEQARAEMNTIGARIAQDHPASNKDWGVAIDPFADIIVSPDLRRSLYLLLAAVGMVLLIGCANLANLMLARGLARDREVAIRAALGAGRGRLLRQFLTESVLLSGAGGVLGIGLGYATMRGLKFAASDNMLPPEAHVTIDAWVLGFALVLAVITGLGCGVMPALQAARPDLTKGLKQAGGGSSAGRTRGTVRSILVVLEVALAFVLLTGAGLLLRSFAKLQGVDLGFNATNVLTAQVPIPQQRFTEAEALHAYRRQIEEAVHALPGVLDSAFTSALPLRGWGYGMPFQIADQEEVDRSRRPACFFKMVSPTYFSAIGLPVLHGRGLTARDVKGSPPVTVISDAFRRKHFADEDPIGKRINVQEIAFGKTELGPEIPWEIVGVAADENVGELSNTEGTPGMYVTMEQSPVFNFQLVVRTAADPGMLFQPLRDAVRRIDPDQALPEMKTLDQIKTESLGGSRLSSILLGAFAGIALLLATLGLYGVISYSVVQRTREIGIRAAVGATATDIVRLVVRHGMILVAVGLVCGAAGVFALTRLMSAMLFGVGERDPVTIATVAGILFVVALIACWLPARRAARIDPLVALRTD